MAFVLQTEKVIPYKSGYKTVLSLYKSDEPDNDFENKVVIGIREAKIIAPDGHTVTAAACGVREKTRSKRILRSLKTKLVLHRGKLMQDKLERKAENEWINWNFF